jgi:serpin B
MLKFLQHGSVILIFAVLAAACVPPALPSVTPGPAAVEQSLQASIPRLASPGLEVDYVSDLVQGNNGFAFDLYHTIIQNDHGNLIYSPYSISLAFSMAYAGARGETEAQMAEVLRYLPQQTHHLAFNALDQHFTSLGRDSENEDNDDLKGEPFQLNIANAIWGQQGYPFKEEYLEVLAQNYGAGLRTVDFTEDPEAARQAINRWIEEQTQDRIQDILPPGVIDALTRLVLANAIYFKGSWLFPFSEPATQFGPFTLLDGSQVNVPLMRRSNTFLRYLQRDGYQAALLPYTGDAIQMLVILPDSGQFEEVESRLDPEFVDNIWQEAARQDLTLVMPKLDFESELSLKELLIEMGMTAPFGAADFGGIAGEDELFISNALHKANITVDEKGTEAAAATVIVMPGSAPIEEPIELRLDRPFIFAILEQETGSILFLGRVMNPGQ